MLIARQYLLSIYVLPIDIFSRIFYHRSSPFHSALRSSLYESRHNFRGSWKNHVTYLLHLIHDYNLLDIRIELPGNTAPSSSSPSTRLQNEISPTDSKASCSPSKCTQGDKIIRESSTYFEGRCEYPRSGLLGETVRTKLAQDERWKSVREGKSRNPVQNFRLNSSGDKGSIHCTINAYRVRAGFHSPFWNIRRREVVLFREARFEFFTDTLKIKCAPAMVATDCINFSNGK